jgi:hypothetical protein
MVSLAFLALFALLNLWAFRHVWAMTHFSNGGRATIRPEELSPLARAGVLLAGVNVPRPNDDRTPADVGLDFSVLHLTTVDGMDLEAWHVPAREPRAIVALFHGYAGCKARLLGEARAFHDLGSSAVLVDFRGSGGSGGNATTLGVFEANDVVATSRAAQDLAPAIPLVLYGRSMGSVAILRAISHDGLRPAGIILECPFDSLLGTVKSRFSAMGLPSFPSAELMVFWGGVQHGINGFAHNPVEYAAHVTCPTLLLHGESDKRVAVSEAQAVFDALAGEKRLEIYPGVGHEACHRTRPDLWERHVGEVLDGLRSR